MEDAPRKPSPHDTATRSPRWGLREALLAWVAATFVGVVSFLAVLTIGGYSPRVPERPGGYIGRAFAQTATGDPLVDDAVPVLWQMLTLVPGWIVLLGVAWFVAGVLGHDRRGWHIGRTPSDIPLGIAAGLFLQVPVMVMVSIIMQGILGDFSPSGRALTLIDAAATSPVSIIAVVVAVAIGAPIVEELFYRGIVQGALVERLGWPGVVIASAIFGAVHLNMIEFFPLTVAGLAFGLLAYGTGRLLPAIVAHMAFNGFTLAVLFGAALSSSGS